MLFEKFELLDNDELEVIFGGDASNIPANLKLLRLTSGMSRNKLASIIGVDPTSVTHWEHGNNAPDIDTLIKLADVFEKNVDDIIR